MNEVSAAEDEHERTGAVLDAVKTKLGNALDKLVLELKSAGLKNVPGLVLYLDKRTRPIANLLMDAPVNLNAAIIEHSRALEAYNEAWKAYKDSKNRLTAARKTEKQSRKNFAAAGCSPPKE